MKHDVKRTMHLELTEQEAADMLHILYCWNEHGKTELHPDSTRLVIKMLGVLTDFFS